MKSEEKRTTQAKSGQAKRNGVSCFFSAFLCLPPHASRFLLLGDGDQQPSSKFSSMTRRSSMVMASSRFMSPAAVPAEWTTRNGRHRPYG